MSTLFRAQDYGTAEGALQEALRLYNAEVDAGNRALIQPRRNRWGTPWAYVVVTPTHTKLSSLLF